MNTFYRLLGFLRPYKRGVIIAALLASGAMVMTVLVPRLTGWAVEAVSKGVDASKAHDAAAESHYQHNLELLALAIAVAAVVRWGLSYARRIVAGRVSLAIEYDLRKIVYGRLQALELGVLRPPADRPTDVAGDSRPLGGALLPRLRPRVHPAVGADDRARDDRDAPDQSAAGRDRDRSRAVRDRDQPTLRSPGPARRPGDTAANRRTDRQRRGEHHRCACRQVVRPRGRAARAASARASGECSSSRWWRRGWKPSSTR